MNTQLNAHVCPLCSYRIDSYGYPCSSLFDMAIMFYLRNKPLKYSDVAYEQFKKPLEFLEKKGILLSTECKDNYIQIIPNLHNSCHLSPNPTNDAQGDKKPFCWC